MARLQRQAPVGIPQHIIQRGNNRQVCFGGEQGKWGQMRLLLSLGFFDANLIDYFNQPQGCGYCNI